MEVRLEGVRELERKMANSKQFMDHSLTSLLRDLSSVGKAVAKHNLEGGLGMAKQSVRTEVKRDVATVFTLMPHARAKSIEEGRRPGERVSFLQIARWLTKRRHLTSRRLSELSEHERSQIAIVQSNIQTSGTKGKAYMAAAAESVKKKAPAAVQKLARAIEANWRR